MRGWSWVLSHLNYGNLCVPCHSLCVCVCVCACVRARACVCPALCFFPFSLSPAPPPPPPPLRFPDFVTTVVQSRPVQTVRPPPPRPSLSPSLSLYHLPSSLPLRSPSPISLSPFTPFSPLRHALSLPLLPPPFSLSLPLPLSLSFQSCLPIRATTAWVVSLLRSILPAWPGPSNLSVPLCGCHCTCLPLFWGQVCR